jgi:hypothetical protein
MVSLFDLGLLSSLLLELLMGLDIPVLPLSSLGLLLVMAFPEVLSFFFQVFAILFSFKDLLFELFHHLLELFLDLDLFLVCSCVLTDLKSHGFGC